MSPIREGGKSSPSLSMKPPLECQDVSRFKAIDPPRFNPVRRTHWSDTWPLVAVFAWVVIGALWLVVPDWLRFICIVATPLVAAAALWPLWRGRL